MKLIILIGSLIIIVSSCSTKQVNLPSHLENQRGQVLGKWKIAKFESTITSEKMIEPFHSEFYGAQNDYYEFLPTGKLHVRIGSTLKEINYKFSADRNLILIGDSFTDTLSVTIATDHQLQFKNARNTLREKGYEKIENFAR